VDDDDADDEDDEDFEPDDSGSDSESDSESDDDDGDDDIGDNGGKDEENAGVQYEDEVSAGVQYNNEEEQSAGVDNEEIENASSNDNENNEAMDPDNIPGVETNEDISEADEPDNDNGNDEIDDSDEQIDSDADANEMDTIRRSDRSNKGITSKYEDYVHTTVASGPVNVLNPRMFSRGAIDVATGTDMPRKDDAPAPPQIACNVFATCGDDLNNDDQILLLNINETNSNGYDETIMAQTDAEWMFLTQNLGWGEGLASDSHDIEQGEEYLFTTDQMNWKKGSARLFPSIWKEFLHNHLHIPKSSGRVKDGASRYTGVRIYKQMNKWQAQIEIDGKQHCIGYYGDEEEAVVDYARALLKYRGREQRQQRQRESTLDLSDIPPQTAIPKSSGHVKDGASKYTGVSFSKQMKKWLAQIMIGPKKHFIG